MSVGLDRFYCIYMSGLTEMQTVFYRQIAWEYMNSASNEYRNISARRGAQFEPIGISIIYRKSFPEKNTKILSTRNSSILDYHQQVSSRTRQIIIYLATTIHRRRYIRHYTASKKGEGYQTNENIINFDKVWNGALDGRFGKHPDQRC